VRFIRGNIILAFLTNVSSRLVILFRKIVYVITLLSFLSAGYAFAAMKSSNYKIDADTLNSGGNLSSSSNYKEGDTLGESVIGEGSSASYKAKAGFWYMFSAGSMLGLACESSDVYMVDYTLGDPSNASTYLFSTSEECIVTDNSDASWTLTVQSTNMTSASNDLSNTNINLSTDGTISSSPTIANPTSNITETSVGDYSLDSIRTIITGNVSASGDYNVRPLNLSEKGNIKKSAESNILYYSL